MNKGRKKMKKNNETKFKVKGPEAIEDDFLVKTCEAKPDRADDQTELSL